MLYNRNVSVKHHTDEKEELFLAVSFLYVIPFRLAIVAKHLHYTMYSTSHSVFNGNGNVISFLSIMKIDFKKKIFYSSFRRSNSCQTFQIWYCFYRYVFIPSSGELERKKTHSLQLWIEKIFTNIFQRHNID